jgi:hypothetical protein
VSIRIITFTLVAPDGALTQVRQYDTVPIPDGAMNIMDAIPTLEETQQWWEDFNARR